MLLYLVWLLPLLGAVVLWAFGPQLKSWAGPIGSAMIGVPFARGQLTDAARVHVMDERGRECPASVRPLELWRPPQGATDVQSIRAVQVQVPVDIPDGAPVGVQSRRSSQSSVATRRRPAMTSRPARFRRCTGRASSPAARR